MAVDVSDARFEVLTAVLLRILFWEVMPRCLLGSDAKVFAGK